MKTEPYIGQCLRIPTQRGNAYIVQEGDTKELLSGSAENYEKTEANQLVVDYIASMTDDYFIALHERLFPSSAYKLKYRGYFD